MEELRIETLDENIVEHDFEMLKHEMMEVLAAESMAGNAGTIDINGQLHTCAAANGYADQETGKINAFGNYQDVPDEIKDRSQHFTLRAAVAGKLTSLEDALNYKTKIVDFFESDKFSGEARFNIEEAIDRFNSQ